MYAKHENGVFLLGSNKYWKEFVADYFGEQIEEDDDTKYLEESLDKYVELWCRKYQNPKNIDIWIKSLSDMCHRIVDLERATRKNTKDLKEFVADYFGEQIEADDDTKYLEESLDKYVELWCREHQDPQNFDIWVKLLSGMCRRIIELERELRENPPLLSYQTHVDKKGWGDGWTDENQFSNPLDKKHDIQAIKIDFPNHNVYYSVYFNEKRGWSAESSNSQQAGTIGKRRPITGIKIRLDEADAKEFDILYRMHKFDDEWTPWAKNGEELISDGIKLNAIQIKLQPKFKTA